MSNTNAEEDFLHEGDKFTIEGVDVDIRGNVCVNGVSLKTKRKIIKKNRKLCVHTAGKSYTGKGIVNTLCEIE